jgi:hypothetical protein
MMHRLFLCLIIVALLAGCSSVPTLAPRATPTQEPTPRLPPPIPPLPAPTFNACQPDPNPDAAPNYPVYIVGINKGTEVVTLKNVSPDEVDLTSWHMCSIREHQEHPISGSLAPGEQKDFPGSAGDIWSNSDTDNGSLYNAEGQLVSFFNS